MQSICLSEPKFPAVRRSLNARRFSARAEIPSGISRSAPKFLAIITNLNARCCLVRTEIPGGFYQFACDAFFGQNQNSWRYFPI